MTPNEKDVKFERFTDVLSALDYVKSTAPERAFVEIDAELEVDGVRGPFKGRFVGVYQNGNYNLKRLASKKTGPARFCVASFRGRGGVEGRGKRECKGNALKKR